MIQVLLAHQAFRYELAPTAGQTAALANHAGAARWAWNWGLAVRRKAWHRRQQTLSAVELHRLLNRLKRTPQFAWLYEVSKTSTELTRITGVGKRMAGESASRGSRSEAAAPSGFG